MASGVYTHTHTYTNTFMDKSDYEKPGMSRPAAGAPGSKMNLNRKYVYHLVSQLLYCSIPSIKFPFSLWSAAYPNAFNHMAMTLTLSSLL